LGASHQAEAKRLFYEADAPQNVADTRELSAWLCTKARDLSNSGGQPIEDQTREISLREILKVEPNPDRDSLRRDVAIDYLEDASHLRRQEMGKQKRARINIW